MSSSNPVRDSDESPPRSPENMEDSEDSFEMDSDEVPYSNTFPQNSEDLEEPNSPFEWDHPSYSPLSESEMPAAESGNVAEPGLTSNEGRFYDRVGQNGLEDISDEEGDVHMQHLDAQVEDMDEAVTATDEMADKNSDTGELILENDPDENIEDDNDVPENEREIVQDSEIPENEEERTDANSEAAPLDEVDNDFDDNVNEGEQAQNENEDLECEGETQQNCEDEQIEDENTDALAEDADAEAEDAEAEAEDADAQAEDADVQAEDEDVQAEDEDVQAEDGDAQAEDEDALAEDEDVQAEDEDVQAEDEDAQAEAEDEDADVQAEDADVQADDADAQTEAEDAADQVENVDAQAEDVDEDAQAENADDGDTPADEAECEEKEAEYEGEGGEVASEEHAEQEDPEVDVAEQVVQDLEGTEEAEANGGKTENGSDTEENADVENKNSDHGVLDDEKQKVNDGVRAKKPKGQKSDDKVKSETTDDLLDVDTSGVNEKELEEPKNKDKTVQKKSNTSRKRSKNQRSKKSSRSVKKQEEKHNKKGENANEMEAQAVSDLTNAKDEIDSGIKKDGDKISKSQVKTREKQSRMRNRKTNLRNSSKEKQDDKVCESENTEPTVCNHDAETNSVDHEDPANCDSKTESVNNGKSDDLSVLSEEQKNNEEVLVKKTTTKRKASTESDQSGTDDPTLFKDRLKGVYVERLKILDVDKYSKDLTPPSPNKTVQSKIKLDVNSRKKNSEHLKQKPPQKRRRSEPNPNNAGSEKNCDEEPKDDTDAGNDGTITEDKNLTQESQDSGEIQKPVAHRSKPGKKLENKPKNNPASIVCHDDSHTNENVDMQIDQPSESPTLNSDSASEPDISTCVPFPTCFVRLLRLPYSMYYTLRHCTVSIHPLPNHLIPVEGGYMHLPQDILFKNHRKIPKKKGGRKRKPQKRDISKPFSTTKTSSTKSSLFQQISQNLERSSRKSTSPYKMRVKSRR